MGLTLVIDDFKRVIKYPKAVSVGLFNQLILLPLIAFGLAILFNLTPAIAVGLMILAACPGGVTSNLITYVSKGDTALSITLTAIGSFITVITIPMIISFSLIYFLADDQSVQLNVLQTIAQVFGITVLPVSIGMFIRDRKPDFAKRMERPSKIASTVIFLVILLGIILANKHLLVSSIKSVGAVTLLLNLITMGLGFLAAKIFKLNFAQSLTITIESGIQNGTLALVIATTILKNAEMTLAPAIYSLIMFITGGLLMAYFGSRKEKAV